MSLRRSCLLLSIVLVLASLASAMTISGPFVDDQTKGAWVGKYGQDGYVLLGWNSYWPEVSLPSYANYGWSGNPYVWATTTSDPRALQNPVWPVDRRATCMYGSSIGMSLYPLETRQFDLGLYMLDWDRIGREATISFIANGVTLLEHSASDFGEGKWFNYRITAQADDPPVDIMIRNEGTGNAVLSAMVFGVLPEPASLGVLAMGGLALLCRRRKA